ncbi:MAG: VWA domain-containing protein [Candidatus Neomarinimicrobiota bacterium]
MNESARLHHKVTHYYDLYRRNWKYRIGLTGMIILVMSAAGPRIGTRVKPVERKGIDLIFAMDVSISMDAEDVKPSRLKKAKFEIAQIIRQLKGDRVGIIVFAGSSYYYLPMTADYEAAQIFLESIDTKMITTQGTVLSAAIATALSIFPEDSDKFKVLVLVTDGEDHDGKAVSMSKKAAKAGIVVHTIGVGSTAGSLIPVTDNEGTRLDYKRDKEGKLVTSAINEEILNDVSEAGGGIFIRLDNSSGSYKDIVQAIDQMEKKTMSTHEYSEFEDRYQLFAVSALMLIILAFMISTKPKRNRKDNN